MTNLSGTLLPLRLYETKVIVPLRSFTPDTYTQKMHVEANSILSTVFVESLDVGATVKVNYYDTTTGEDEGERFDLVGHDIITAPTIPESSRVLVTKIHDKPVVEIVVTGGNVVLGLYITAISSFASDLDSALKKDNSVALLSSDKGIPIMTYDEMQNKYYILRSEMGTLPVSVSEAGNLIHSAVSITTTPGVLQELIDVTVPDGFMRKISQVVVVCRSHGFYTVESDSAIIGSGRTGPASTKDIFPWNPRITIAAGNYIKVNFTADESSPVSNVEAYLMATDV